MRTIKILCLLAGILFFFSCGNNDQKTDQGKSSPTDSIGNVGTTGKADTLLKPDCLEAAPLSVLKEEQLFNEEISWPDFRANFEEFDRLRRTLPDIRNAKTKYVRFDITKLAGYLRLLKDNNIDSVDVFVGKYLNQANQPSGTPIDQNHRGKMTVMFAGAGTNETTNPYPRPWNVGNPWP